MSLTGTYAQENNNNRHFLEEEEDDEETVTQDNDGEESIISKMRRGTTSAASKRKRLRAASTSPVGEQAHKTEFDDALTDEPGLSASDALDEKEDQVDEEFHEEDAPRSRRSKTSKPTRGLQNDFDEEDGDYGSMSDNTEKHTQDENDQRHRSKKGSSSKNRSERKHASAKAPDSDSDLVDDGNYWREISQVTQEESERLYDAAGENGTGKPTGLVYPGQEDGELDAAGNWVRRSRRAIVAPARYVTAMVDESLASSGLKKGTGRSSSSKKHKRHANKDSDADIYEMKARALPRERTATKYSLRTRGGDPAPNASSQDFALNQYLQPQQTSNKGEKDLENGTLTSTAANGMEEEDDEELSPRKRVQSRKEPIIYKDDSEFDSGADLKSSKSSAYGDETSFIDRDGEVEEEEDDDEEDDDDIVGYPSRKSRRKRSRYSDYAKKGRTTRSLRKKEPINYAKQMYPDAFKDIDVIEAMDRLDMLPSNGGGGNGAFGGGSRWNAGGAKKKDNQKLFRLNEDEEDTASPPPQGRLFALLRNGAQKPNAIMPLNLNELIKAQREALLKHSGTESRHIFEQNQEQLQGTEGKRR